MIKKTCGVLFILVVLLCTLNNPLAAQSQSCTNHFVLERYDFLLGNQNGPKGCIWLAPSEVPFSAVLGCWVSTCEAMEWCPTCGMWVPSAGAPINLTNGNTYIQQKDVRVPGLGGGLMLERTWNSIVPTSLSAFQVGMFGPNWRSTYEERVFTGGGAYTGFMLYLRADGGLWVFSSNGSNWTLTAPARVIATLTQNGTQSWTLAFQNGEQRVFSYTSGSLTSIIDRNGNKTQLTYDGSNRLTTVTDPVSRTLSFAYGSSYSNFLVTGVSTSVGISLSYSYDSQGRLIQVTEPDQTTLSFTYNSQSLITAVTDSQGITLESHTYDSQNRGLTSSRAGGVDAVTITYPQ